MNTFFPWIYISRVTPVYGAAMKIDINIYVEKCIKSSTCIYNVYWVLEFCYFEILNYSIF